MTGGTRIAALYFGFVSAIAQVLFIREFLSVLRGNELVIGAVFTAWFLGIFAGALYNPVRDRDTLMKRVRRALIALPLSVPVAIYTLHSLPLLVPQAAGGFYPVALEFALGTACTIPAGFLIGRFFPPLVALDSAVAGASSGGRVYAVESFGSFAGGLAFAFLLVDRVNPLGISAILVMCALASLAALTADRRPLYLMALPLALALLSGPAEKVLFTTLWGARHNGTLVAYERTRYQTVQAEKDEGSINVYGNGVFYYTLPDRYGARGLFHLLKSLQPRRGARVLILGGGPGALPLNLLKTDLASLHYCEPDLMLWKMLKVVSPATVSALEGDGRFMLIAEDVSSWLRRTGTRYDLILCLAPPPESAMLNRFYTAEFYALCASRLGAEGVFITPVHGFSNYMGGDVRHYIASLYRSFTASLPFTLFTSGETMYFIGAGRPGVLPAGGKELAARYARTPPAPERERLDGEITLGFNPSELLMFFEQTQLDYFRSTIPPLAVSEPANTETNPRIYWRQLMLTLLQERSALYTLFRNPAAPAAIVLAAACAALWHVKRRRGRPHAWGASLILCTGFVSISLMLTLMLTYQHFYGVIFHRISLVNALYMFGLGTGSIVMTWTGARFLRAVPLTLLVAVAVFLLFLHTRNEAFFWAGTLLLSLLSGAVFPGVFTAISAGRYQEAASTLDSIEHLGAIAGSFLTPAVLLHTLGITGTLLCNALLIVLMAVLSATGPGPQGDGGRSHSAAAVPPR